MDKKELLRTIKFAIISASAGIIQFGSFALFNEFLHLSWNVAYIASLALSVIWNFTLNRKITFQSANNVPIAMLKVFGFYCVFTPVSTILGNFLTGTLLWNDYVVEILIMILNMITEYLFDKYVVFRDAIDNNKEV